MKFVFGLLFFAFCSVAVFSQTENFEKDFEKNKLKYKLEKFAEGEDASSGYDYLVYVDKKKVVKIREIWSSLSYSTYRAEDYFFRDGKLIAVFKYTFPKKYYKASANGANIPLKLVEKMYLTEQKMTVWIENGKPVPNTDKRWAETEKNVLESANYKLEDYERFKAEGN
jgi:hypothetical protein